MWDFQFDGNSNFCPATVYKILTVEMCISLTLNCRIGQNMPIESQYVTSCVGNSNVCTLSPFAR